MAPSTLTAVVNVISPRPTPDRGAKLAELLQDESAYDLCMTNGFGINAFWLAATLWDRETSLREIEMLVKAARCFSADDPADEPPRMLVHCQRVDGELRMVKPDAECGFVMPDPEGASGAAGAAASAGSGLGVATSGGACAAAAIEARLKIPVYRTESLSEPAWRWVMLESRLRDAVGELALPVALPAVDPQKAADDSDDETSRYALFTSAGTDDKASVAAIDIELRFCLALAAMHPSARRQAFSGLWMACRAGNVELLDFVLRENTPWAAVARRVFTWKHSEDNPVDRKYAISGEPVFGEVWREMPLPQRAQSCGQAALMSANVELVELLEERLGKDTFWENCLFVGGQGMVDEDMTYEALGTLGKKLQATGLLVRKQCGEGTAGDAAGAAAAGPDEQGMPALKRQRVDDTADGDDAEAPAHAMPAPTRQKRWYAWGMAQALAVHVFVRENERPLTGSITGFVRNARGDLEEEEPDLHGPDVLKRSVDVLKKVVAARDRDESIRGYLFEPPPGMPADGSQNPFALATVLQRFALPFCFAVESGNQPAFEWMCRELEAFVDAHFDIDLAKLNGPSLGGVESSSEERAQVSRPGGLKLAVPAAGEQLGEGRIAAKASDLIKGVLAEFSLEQEGRNGFLRSTLWYAHIGPFRFAKECKGRNPQWRGADANAFPREFETEKWVMGVLFELIRCLFVLHPHMMIRSFDDTHVWLDGSECAGLGPQTFCAQVKRPLLGVKFLQGDANSVVCGGCEQSVSWNRKETFTDVWTASMGPAAVFAPLAVCEEAAWFEEVVRSWLQRTLVMDGNAAAALAATSGTTTSGQGRLRSEELFWGSLFSRLFTVHGVRGIKKLTEELELEVDWGYALCGFRPRAKAA